jgi:putative FmdB family regulatory protein
MPIYEYECSYCQCTFEEFRKITEASGKSFCPKCGMVSFKLPSVIRPVIFKQREFADGTKTPDNIRTFKQEENWKKKEKIHYDKPTGKEKRHRTEERKATGFNQLQKAFQKANRDPSRQIKNKIQELERR